MPSIQQIPNSGSDGRFLDNFKGRLAGGGVRPNLFEVEIPFPAAALPSGVSDSQINDKIRFLVKATSLPASTITPIPVPFRGRTLQIAGDRTFEPWTISVLNDTDFVIRNSFERWMNFINRNSDNSGQIDPAVYQVDAKVYQLGRAPTTNAIQSANSVPILRYYNFHGIFPTSVSGITLSYDANSQIEEFQVDLQVQWWEAYDGNNSVQVR
jgi:hypothetical protein